MNTFPEADSHSSSKQSATESRTKYILILLVGVLLHMVFVGENTLINYLINTADYPGERSLGGLLMGLYGTFAYAGAGIIFSLLIIGPVVHFSTPKPRRYIWKSVAYAVCIGVVFRILSYFMDTQAVGLN